MIELLAASLLTCESGQEIIDNLNRSKPLHREELVEVIKENSEPHAFNRRELNEGSEIRGSSHTYTHLQLPTICSE